VNELWGPVYHNIINFHDPFQRVLVAISIHIMHNHVMVCLKPFLEPFKIVDNNKRVKKTSNWLASRATQRTATSNIFDTA